MHILKEGGGREGGGLREDTPSFRVAILVFVFSYFSADYEGYISSDDGATNPLLLLASAS